MVITEDGWIGKVGSLAAILSRDGPPDGGMAIEATSIHPPASPLMPCRAEQWDRLPPISPSHEPLMQAIEQVLDDLLEIPARDIYPGGYVAAIRLSVPQLLHFKPIFGCDPPVNGSLPQVNARSFAFLSPRLRRSCQWTTVRASHTLSSFERPDDPYPIRAFDCGSIAMSGTDTEAVRVGQIMRAWRLCVREILL